MSAIKTNIIFIPALTASSERMVTVVKHSNGGKKATSTYWHNFKVVKERKHVPPGTQQESQTKRNRNGPLLN
jgi:hypothetical protein